MGYQPSENGQPYWPHPWNKDADKESSHLDITISPRRSRASDLVVGTLLLVLLGLSGGLLYSCREDSKRAQEINSFQLVGGREVYRQQRLEWLRRQLGELDRVDPAMRDAQRRLLEQAIQEIDSDYTQELD